MVVLLEIFKVGLRPRSCVAMRDAVLAVLQSFAVVMSVEVLLDVQTGVCGAPIPWVWPTQRLVHAASQGLTQVEWSFRLQEAVWLVKIEVVKRTIVSQFQVDWVLARTGSNT